MIGGIALVEFMHAAGSPQTQKVIYARMGKIDMKKKMAKKLAGIEVEAQKA
jgi:4-hydroxybutyryl-CoA dehydratase/vinylacetyl-CoA-Delta-isomerase